MPERAGAVADLGYITVGLFFILSGFVLTYAYSGGEGKVDKEDFYRNRFARIYPVYALAMLVALPAFSRAYEYLQLPRGEFGIDVLLRFLLIHAWHPGTMKYYNVPSWSLSCEAFFYLLFPFLMPTIFRIKPDKVFRSLVCVWALAVFGPVLYEWAYPGSSPAVENYRILLIKFHPLIRLPEFLMGMLLGRLFVGSAERLKMPDRWVWAAVAVIVLAVLVRTPYVLLHTGGLAAPFAVIVWALASQKGRIAQFLSAKPMQVLGESSYALYICHVPFFQVLLEVAAGTGVPVMNLGFAFFAIVVLIALSVLIHYTFERPLRKRLRAPVYEDYDA